jgi:hypothetical protein
MNSILLETFAKYPILYKKRVAPAGRGRQALPGGATG